MPESDAVAKLISSANWYHSFEVLPGIFTPGKHVTNASEVFDSRFCLPHDLSGKSALDIGALDGPYSFELERRGASVTALDIQRPDRTGFSVAKQVRGSNVRYVQGSVYDVARLLDEKFDIVTFFGVWYHLKNPVAAFEQLRLILKDDGLLLFEGECFLSYAEVPDGSPGIADEALRLVAGSRLPLSLYYAGPYKKDPWSWYIPNPACVEEWLKTAGLEMTSQGFWHDHPHQRMYGAARNVPRAEISIDNPVW